MCRARVNPELPRASAIRVTPLDEEGNQVGEPFTTVGRVSVEFDVQLPVDTSLPPLQPLALEWPIYVPPLDALCIRVHGDHESDYGPDAHGVLHWRCVRCWIDRCLPGDCPTEKLDPEGYLTGE